MKTGFYLIVNSKGATKTCKKRSWLNFDEGSIYLTLDLPDRLFEKPILTGKIEVPDASVSPAAITPEIKNNIEEAIQESSGVEVKLEISEPKS